MRKKYVIVCSVVGVIVLGVAIFATIGGKKDTLKDGDMDIKIVDKVTYATENTTVIEEETTVQEVESISTEEVTTESVTTEVRTTASKVETEVEKKRRLAKETEELRKNFDYTPFDNKVKERGVENPQRVYDVEKIDDNTIMVVYNTGAVLYYIDSGEYHYDHVELEPPLKDMP